jgi:hypothetical protein
MKITIYKIKDLETGKFYLGSTKMNVNKRISVHKSTLNNNDKRCNSHKIIKDNNYRIDILDIRIVKNEIEKLQLENLYYLISKKFCKDLIVNDRLPYRSKEYKKFYDKQRHAKRKLSVNI